MELKGKQLVLRSHGRLTAADKRLSARMLEWRTQNKITKRSAAALLGLSDGGAWNRVESGVYFARPEFFEAIEALTSRPVAQPATTAAPAPDPLSAFVPSVPPWVHAQLAQLTKRLAALETALGVQTPIDKANAGRGPNGSAPQ